MSCSRVGPSEARAQVEGFPGERHIKQKTLALALLWYMYKGERGRDSSMPWGDDGGVQSPGDEQHMRVIVDTTRAGGKAS